MNLLSLNVALFEKNNHTLKSFLKSHPVDIACFQEVAQRTDNTANPEYDSLYAIDTATKSFPHHFYAPVMSLEKFATQGFHGEKDFSIHFGGYLNFGLYTKSKFPITYGKLTFTEKQLSRISHTDNWPKEQCRAAQVSDLLLENNQPLRVINYHGHWTKDKIDTPESLKASDILIQLAQEANYPVIICGDFNLFPHTKSIQKLSQLFTNLSDTYHIQTTRPQSNELSKSAKRNVVDYIFTSPSIHINDFVVPNSDISDHLPLILDFDI
jgi:endonuclease/exonuclease/phosphatase family metal-dependent hydrolase